MRLEYINNQTIFTLQYLPANRAYMFNRYDHGHCGITRIIQDKEEALKFYNDQVEFYKQVKGL